MVVEVEDGKEEIRIKEHGRKRNKKERFDHEKRDEKSLEYH